MFARMSAQGTLTRTSADAPDFRHISTWVFDLDHTLYRMDEPTMKEVEARITRFVQRHLGLPRDEAYAIQKKYLRDYGITLAGMMKHHGVDPDVYHAEINDIEALALKPHAELRAALVRLPGERFVFTNNCGNFAREVLSRLAIDDLFSTILDIRALGYVPKPASAAYDVIVSHARSAPSSIALFDDRACNLLPAHALGMTTVWPRHGVATLEEQAAIDFETDDLVRFLNAIRTV
jgi:putative hydrolase of the HAD superfamily